MAESLKDVIAKIKANQQQQQNSQASDPKNAVRRAVPKAPVPMDDDEDAGIDAIPVPQPQQIQAPQPMPQQQQPVETPELQETEEKQAEIEAIVRDMELLQNNGRYRVELLHQFNEFNKTLIEINRALVLMADVLVGIKYGKA